MYTLNYILVTRYDIRQTWYRSLHYIVCFIEVKTIPGEIPTDNTLGVERDCPAVNVLDEL